MWPLPTELSRLVFCISCILQGLFVDNSRNAAVNFGDRDLKADVKSKARRDRSHLNVRLGEICETNAVIYNNKKNG